MQESIKIEVDTSQLKSVLDELKTLANVSEISSELIQVFFDGVSNTELFEIEDNAALRVRTGDLAVILKPSNKLLKFVSTFRAG